MLNGKTTRAFAHDLWLMAAFVVDRLRINVVSSMIASALRPPGLARSMYALLSCTLSNTLPRLLRSSFWLANFNCINFCSNSSMVAAKGTKTKLAFRHVVNRASRLTFVDMRRITIDPNERCHRNFKHFIAIG